MEGITPEEIAALKNGIFSSLHCALPGTVLSFDAVTQTAAVQPALKHGTIALPALRDVPVFFPGSRGQGITWPVEAGDECLLVFADGDIDRWFESGEAEDPASGRRHDLSDAFAFVGFRSRGNALRDLPEGASFFGVDPADVSHLHDDRYYTESETDTKLSGKADASHLHDDRYYTESETDTKLSGKANSSHTHAAGDIASGSLALNRGGSGQTGTGSTTTISDIATAASDCEITTAQYAYWGKVAMVRLVVKKTTAVSSGTTTLCTLVSGKRPKYNAAATKAWNDGALVATNGRVQVNGAISAGASLTIMSTYILA